MSRAAACLRPWVIWPAWACLIALLVLYPVFPAFFNRWQFVPFLAGMVFLGLPHGAMDHLVMPFVSGKPLTARYLAAFFAAYLLLVVVYLALWRMAPGPALALFLLLSWLHWGQGDAYALHVFLRRPLPRAWTQVLLTWAMRGALPIVLSVLAFPAVFHQVAQGIGSWYGLSVQQWVLTPPVCATGFAVLAVLCALYAWSAWQSCGRAHRRAFWTDMAEVVLLAVFFARVPPILAVGVYFCAWHALRHIARLMLADPKAFALLAQGKTGRAFARTALLSLPLTVAALCLLGGLYASQAHRASDAGGVVFLYLSLIAALTFPHFLLVLWMDRQEHLLSFAETASHSEASENIAFP